MMTPLHGTTWDVVLSNAVLGRTAFDLTAINPVATYTMTLNGTPYTSGPGTLTWEANGYEDAWSARFTLPATPGILVVVATISATINGNIVTGSQQQSLQVV